MKIRITFAALTLAFVVLIGCRDWYLPVNPKNPQDTVNTTPPASLQNTKWCLTAMGSANTVATPVDPTVHPYMVFDVGTIKGDGGCNEFVASYITNGSAITINSVTPLTAQPCAAMFLGVERPFLAGLGAAVSYTITGNELRIIYGNQRAGTISGVLVFNACGVVTPPTPPTLDTAIIGTRWCLDGFEIANSGVFDRADPSLDINIIFGKDQRASGSGGCNTFGADYTAYMGKMKISNLVSTKIACNTANQWESRYFSALGTADAYKLSNGQLTIYYMQNGVVNSMLFHSCGTPGNPGDPGNGIVRGVLGQKFDLPFGSSAVVDLQSNNYNGGMTIKIVSVRDSRCPLGVDCVWQGDAWVTLDVTLAGVTTQVTIDMPGNTTNAAVVNAYKIELLGLSPYPKGNTMIDLKDYVATLLVSPR